MNPFVLFSQITRRLSNSHQYLEPGRYLSSPSLEYKGRAIACCKDGNLSIKLNDDQQLAMLGVKAKKAQGLVLNFQNGRWIQVPYYFHLDWELLTELALSKAKEEYG